LDLRMLLVIV